MMVVRRRRRLRLQVWRWNLPVGPVAPPVEVAAKVARSVLLAVAVLLAPAAAVVAPVQVRWPATWGRPHNSPGAFGSTEPVRPTPVTKLGVKAEHQHINPLQPSLIDGDVDIKGGHATLAVKHGPAIARQPTVARPRDNRATANPNPGCSDVVAMSVERLR